MSLAAPALLPRCSAGGASAVAAARRPRGRALRFAPQHGARRSSAVAAAADMAAAPAPFVPDGSPPWCLSMSAREGAPAFLGTVFAVGHAKANGARALALASAGRLRAQARLR